MATSLLMVALVLVGLVAVRFLPVSSLPDVDYPTIQVQTFYPGASPEVMATTVTAPLEVQLGQIPGLQQMVVVQLGRRVGHHAAVRSRRCNLDIAEQNVQAGDQRGQQLPADRPARAADLREGQPGRPADPHARDHARSRCR